MTAPQPSTSTRMSASARRDQLLDVTTDLVARAGFHSASIEAIARRAGITRAVVYQHFGDLQALLEEVIERETHRALVQVSETTLSDLSEGEPIELMLESLRSYLHAVQNHPTTWRLILMPPQGAPEILHKSITRGRSMVLARMTDAVRPALARNGSEPDAELTARLLSAIADEYAKLVLTDGHRFSPERLLRHARWWLSHAWA
jgi:AcrR family transcriptional regulator